MFRVFYPTMKRLHLAAIACVLIGTAVMSALRLASNKPLGGARTHAVATIRESQTLDPVSENKRGIIKTRRGQELHQLAPLDFRQLDPKLLELVNDIEKKSGFLENPKGFTDGDLNSARLEIWAAILSLPKSDIESLDRFYNREAARELIGDDTAGPLLHYRSGQMAGSGSIRKCEANLLTALVLSEKEVDVSDPFLTDFATAAPAIYAGWASIDADAALKHWNEFIQTRLTGNPSILRLDGLDERIRFYLDRGARTPAAECPNLLSY